MERVRQSWLESLVDPFQEELPVPAQELAQRMREYAPRLRGAPAFDPEHIARLARRIHLPGDAPIEDPLLERVVRVGLAHIDATFQGDHPKYGVGVYADPMHDAFPPTIVAAVDALTLWGNAARAEQLLAYWLKHFVRDDGTIDYYGPSISEYGQLLTTARRLMERHGSEDWLRANRTKLNRLAQYLQASMRADGQTALLKGVPEADEREQPATYFHNSAWAVRGLKDWADVLEVWPLSGSGPAQMRQDALELLRKLTDVMLQVWPSDPQDWWLCPFAEPGRGAYFSRPQGRITANRLGSYTNYRYWPELLSSGVLPHDWMQRIVTARQTAGGQFCGITRFAEHLDDWPLMDYLDGLWTLGRREDYAVSLWGHIYYHQAEGHLTAYEQVSFPPGRQVADYCLPCQLVAVRAARRFVTGTHDGL